MERPAPAVLGSICVRFERKDGIVRGMELDGGPERIELNGDGDLEESNEKLCERERDDMVKRVGIYANERKERQVEKGKREEKRIK